MPQGLFRCTAVPELLHILLKPKSMSIRSDVRLQESACGRYKKKLNVTRRIIIFNQKGSLSMGIQSGAQVANEHMLCLGT